MNITILINIQDVVSNLKKTPYYCAWARALFSVVNLLVVGLLSTTWARSGPFAVLQFEKLLLSLSWEPMQSQAYEI